jgi:serine-type D-Ala-D-Ala carboxypeptidase (penicillin-binding protein 5/6)
MFRAFESRLPMIRALLPLALLAAPVAMAQNPVPLLKSATIASVPEPLMATPPQAFDTLARSAILIDANSGAVLFEKAADSSMPPASMSKMMTVYLVFDLLQSGQIKLSDKVTVLPETWRQWNNQGSTMFLSPDEQVSIEELLHGIITLSGNDACVVLAEGIAGTEAQFVQLMNAKAKEIGLTSSVFTNTTGWPDPNQYVTARDLARIAVATTRNFPTLYKQFYPVPSYSHGKTLGKGTAISQGNRNPILGRVAGADGLKTGHTEEAGFGFTGSAEREGHRMVFVVSGLGSMAERQAESVKLIEWGFRTYKHYPLFKQGEAVAQLPVWMGSSETVAAVPVRTLGATMTRFARKDMMVSIRHQSPLVAPIARGQKIAEVVVRTTGQPDQVTPLVAAEAVEKVSGLGKLGWRLSHLFGGSK